MESLSLSTSGGGVEGDSRPADVGGYQNKRHLATCGLRISAKPTLDNLKPQETTKEADHDVGLDGAGLSCPGSSVVADGDNKDVFRRVT